MTLRSQQWEQRFLQLALLERGEKIKVVADELSEIIRPHNLTALFDEFVEATQTAIHHHTDSYTHDNGFDKIVLFQDNETRMKMRLRIWHSRIVPNTKRERQNVHNHRWDFSSAVLIGYADNVSYRFADPGEDGEEFLHYRYYARGSKEHYEVEERGKTKLVCAGTRRVAKDEVYSVEAETLHRVDTPDDELVATLVYVSQEGLNTLKARLEKAQVDLKAVRYDKVIAYTATGDTWHDNPYFNKLEQDERSKEGEIAELSGQIANARLYSTDKRNTTRVALGSIVHLHRYFKVSGQEDEQVWEVSGYGEIDVPRQRVAYNAPLMQAVMGLHVGESAETGSPQGPVEYEIIALFANWDDVPSNLKNS